MSGTRSRSGRAMAINSCGCGRSAPPGRTGGSWRPRAPDIVALEIARVDAEAAKQQADMRASNARRCVRRRRSRSSSRASQTGGDRARQAGVASRSSSHCRIPYGCGAGHATRMADVTRRQRSTEVRIRLAHAESPSITPGTCVQQNECPAARGSGESGDLRAGVPQVALHPRVDARCLRGETDRCSEADPDAKACRQGTAAPRSGSSGVSATRRSRSPTDGVGVRTRPNHG